MPTVDIIKTKFQYAQVKNAPYGVLQDFPSIWPSALFLDSTWPIFKLGLDIITINFLKKCLAAQVKNAISILLTRLFYNLA